MPRGRPRIYATKDDAKKAASRKKHEDYRSMYVELLNYKGVPAELKGEHLLVQYDEDTVLDLYNAAYFIQFRYKNKKIAEYWNEMFRDIHPSKDLAESFSGSFSHWILLHNLRPNLVSMELLKEVADDCKIHWTTKSFEPYNYIYDEGKPARRPVKGEVTRKDIEKYASLKHKIEPEKSIDEIVQEAVNSIDTSTSSKEVQSWIEELKKQLGSSQRDPVIPQDPKKEANVGKLRKMLSELKKYSQDQMTSIIEAFSDYYDTDKEKAKKMFLSILSQYKELKS